MLQKDNLQGDFVCVHAFVCVHVIMSCLCLILFDSAINICSIYLFVLFVHKIYQLPILRQGNSGQLTMIKDKNCIK